MTFSAEQKAALSAKLDGAHVRQRTQGGRQVSYIEGWQAIAEANRIFGFDGWDRETAEIKLLGERECKIGKPPYEKDGWRVAYMARVRVVVFVSDQRCVVREGCGYGSGIDADLGAAHESALKEAETDAMKRALMTFGNPFGLALYDKEQENVDRGAPKSPPPASKSLPPPTEAPSSKPLDNSVTDWNLVADDLIHDALKLRSVAEINALWTERKMLRSKGHKGDPMPTEIRDRAKARITAHRDSLLPTVAAG